MTTIQIPLDKEQDVAAVVADMQPGDKVYGCFTIKDNNQQTLTLRISEFSDNPDDLSKPGDAADENDETDDNPDEEKAEGEADQSPEGKEAEAKPTAAAGGMGRKLAAKMMNSDQSY